MRRLALLLLVLAAGGLAVVFYVRTTGLSAMPVPGVLETRAVRFVRGFAVPADVRTRVNPVPASPEALREGLEHFADHCASCHANDGSGDTTLGRSLYPKAPDMRRSATQNMTDGELFWVIENGIRFTGMPGWRTGTQEGEDASWRLVQFLRRLPQLTAADTALMERYNPRSPAEIRQEIAEEQFLQGDSQ